MEIDFQHSDEIEFIAKHLIEEYHPHLQAAAIAYVIKVLDRDKGAKQPAHRPGKKSALAKAIKVPAIYKSLCGFDYVLIVEELPWLVMKQEQKQALIDHELCHMGHDENGWYIRDHDVEEFRQILERHGYWNEELAAFVAAAPEQQELPLKPATGEKRPRVN